MFLRILMWLVMFVAAWWLFRPRDKAPPLARGPAAPAAPVAKLETEAMVDCCHCGLHLPASEALRDDAGRVYCSVEHRVAGPRSGPR